MEFRVLGSFEALHNGVPVALGGPKQRAVLAALLLRPNESVSREYLYSAIWDCPPASPGSNLRTYVSGLRGRFRAAGELRDRLVNQHGRYRLEVRPGELDIATFEEFADLGEQAFRCGDATAAAEHFTRARTLWRGDPLEDQQPGHALRGEIVRLEEKRLLAVARHARARIEIGDGAAVIGELRGVLVERPLREDLWEQLMLALSQAGRPAEALEAFRAARTHL